MMTLSSPLFVRIKSLAAVIEIFITNDPDAAAVWADNLKLIQIEVWIVVALAADDELACFEEANRSKPASHRSVSSVPQNGAADRGIRFVIAAK